MELLVQTLIIGGTGLICAAVLAVAARFLLVREDPRIAAVGGMLPGINCGTCGFAGCADFAKEIVLHGMPPDLCKPGGAEIACKISAFMGLEISATERTVAIVLCKGGDKVAKRTVDYNGLQDCGAAQQVGGNGKACRYGCLGLASCARVCPVHAIEVNDGLALVHPELCISCGKCVAACPRHLIKLVPESRFLHVLCSSLDRGPDVRMVCEVGCIACTLCAKTVGNQGISMRHNLAVVDYATELTDATIIAKCPRHTIEHRTGGKKGST